MLSDITFFFSGLIPENNYPNEVRALTNATVARKKYESSVNGTTAESAPFSHFFPVV